MKSQSVEGAVNSASNFARVFPVEGWSDDNAEVTCLKNIRQCVAINRYSWEGGEVESGGLELAAEDHDLGFQKVYEQPVLPGSVRNYLSIDGGACDGLVDVRWEKVDVDLRVVGVDHDTGK